MGRRLAVPQSEQRKLFQRSGNTCAYPGCNIRLTSAATEDNPLVAVGEIAHIVAYEPDGPRGDPALAPRDRNRYENLLLMCNTHHELIDAQPATYTVEWLLEIKYEHERWVEQQLDSKDIASGQDRSRLVVTVHPQTLPNVDAINDPAQLGIHPAIPLTQPIDGLDTQFPVYIPRDIDGELRKALGEDLGTGGFAVIVGRAACGKSRTAYEAVKAVMPGWRIFLPSEAAELNGLAAANIGDGRIVVWLDELEPFLHDPNLSLRTLRDLTSDPSRPVLIVGTIWPQQYDAITQQPVPPHADRFRTAGRVLKLARRWDLATAFSHNELTKLNTAAQADPRIHEAGRYSAEDGSPTTVLACAPELISRFTTAGNLIGRKVVDAAALARLSGHNRVIPIELLQQLSAQGLTPEEKATVSSGWFSEAISWACQPVRGVAALMKPYAREIGIVDGYEVSDIITSHIYWHTGFHHGDIPASTWQLLVTTSDIDSCETIGSNALQLGHVHIGRHALKRCFETGMGHAAALLGLSHLDEGELDDALRWFSAGYDNGDGECAGLIAMVHGQRGDRKQAKHWLEVSAETDEAMSLLGLGQMHEDAGEYDQAIEYLRRSSAHGFPPAYTSLGNVLLKVGEDDEAEQCWKRAAAAGEAFAMMNLGQRDLDSGRTLGAERWWRAAAELNVVEAMTLLAQHLFDRHRNDEALPWARRAAEAMHPPAWGLFGHLLADRGDVDAGQGWLARGAEAGFVNAMAWYGELLEDTGHLDAAEYWMSKLAIEHQIPAAQARYGIFLHLLGRTEAARPWIRRSFNSGDQFARMLLDVAAKADSVLTEMIFSEVEGVVPPHVVRFPEQVRWTPIEQNCGCVVEWGWDQQSNPEAFMRWCVEMTAANCVWHGADSQTFAPPPDGATIALSGKGTTYYTRQAQGSDVDLGHELTRQLHELLFSSNEDLLASVPGQMRRYFEDEGYDPAEQWMQTRLTDIVLNRRASMDWFGLETTFDRHLNAAPPGDV